MKICGFNITNVSINKNMKQYVNYFYNIVTNINNWDNIDFNKKVSILDNLLSYQKKLILNALNYIQVNFQD